MSTSTTLLHEQEFESETFQDLDLQEMTLEGKGFYDCTFTNVSLSQSTLRSCIFDSCRFINGNLTMVRLYDTTLREVTFSHTKLMGVDWTLARPLTFDVSFQGCILSYGSFVGMRLRKTTVIDCVAEETDFTEANLSETNFRGTRLTGAQFVGTDLSSADLSEASDYNIDPLKNKLAHTRFSLEAALRVAAQFGITVPEVL